MCRDRHRHRAPGTSPPPDWPRGRQWWQLLLAFAEHGSGATNGGARDAGAATRRLTPFDERLFLTRREALGVEGPIHGTVLSDPVSTESEACWCDIETEVRYAER
jgi:hypothetical protein